MVRNEKFYKMIEKKGTFFIAEIGINHGGDLKLAKELIDSAARAGADAVKFQTYITEKRVSRDSPIFEILKSCELSFEDFRDLKSYCDDREIMFFSTPFDEDSIHFLESINVELYKIASFDLVNQKLLNLVANTGKPVILSVGMSNLEEIKSAVEVLNMSCEVALLHCISAYPTLPKDANLGAIHFLRNQFPNLVIGQSDHTNGIEVPLLAIAAGARIIEKHFRISDTMHCVDEVVSISEEKLRELISRAKEIELVLGHGVPGVTSVQKPILQYRRYSNLEDR